MMWKPSKNLRRSRVHLVLRSTGCRVAPVALSLASEYGTKIDTFIVIGSSRLHRNTVARGTRSCGVFARSRWRTFLEIQLIRGARIAEQVDAEAATRGLQSAENQVIATENRIHRVERRRRRRMGLIAWVKRHYYHYSISTGTYSFYPAERIMVNACTMTLFALTSYYIARGVWFALLCVSALVVPAKGP